MMVYMQNRAVAWTFLQKTAQKSAAKFPIAHLEILGTGNLKPYLPAIPVRRNMEIVHRKPCVNRREQTRRQHEQAIRLGIVRRHRVDMHGHGDGKRPLYAPLHTVSNIVRLYERHFSGQLYVQSSERAPRAITVQDEIVDAEYTLLLHHDTPDVRRQRGIVRHTHQGLGGVPERTPSAV